ncbi:MAG: hypothetical protein AB1726_13725 [Planctomycetota bacterium]
MVRPVHPGRLPLRLAGAALLVPLLLAAPAPGLGAGEAREGVTAAAASLEALRAWPGRWVGRPVRLTLQFQGRVERWNPFHTRFGPADWVGFTAWPDERFVWEEEVFADPAPRLFVRRDGPVAAALGGAALLDRFSALVVVREIFLGEPWIEILALEPLAEHVPEGSVLHVERALRFRTQGEPLLAIDQLERARAAPLPPHARAEIDRLIGECAAAAPDR